MQVVRIEEVQEVDSAVEETVEAGEATESRAWNG